MATYADYIAQGLDPSAAAYRARQDMGMTSGQTAGQASAIQQVGMGGGWSPQTFLQNYTNAVNGQGNMIDHGVYGFGGTPGGPPLGSTKPTFGPSGNTNPNLSEPYSLGQPVPNEPWKSPQQKPMQIGYGGQGGGYGGYQGGLGAPYGGYGGQGGGQFGGFGQMGGQGGFSPYRRQQRRGLLW